MKVVLVARDIAPSGAFLRLVQVLRKQEGTEVITHLGHGKPLHSAFSEEIQNDVQTASVVLIGMSSSEQLAQEECATAYTAMWHKISFGFYSDTYDAHNRAWFEPFRTRARFLFVINKMEAEKARLVFPNAEIVVSGNPEWEEFCFPRLTRDEVRENLGVTEDETMVLSPGTKSVPATCILWGAVVEALHSPMLNNRPWKVFLSPHPGDNVSLNEIVAKRLSGEFDKISANELLNAICQVCGSEVDASNIVKKIEEQIRNNRKFLSIAHSALGVYNDLVKFSKPPVNVRVITDDIMSTSDMISGCDLFIESASTTGIRAAHLRKPVIDFFSEIALARMETTAGSSRWEPCELGAAERVHGNPDMLARVIQHLLTRGTFAAQQEKVYPVPAEVGAAVRTMTGVLERVALHSSAR